MNAIVLIALKRLWLPGEPLDETAGEDYGADGVRDLDLLIAKAQISLISVDEELANLARRAFRKFWKGRHPAGLNFGDCFSYALSKAIQEPLLFKGNDFSQTDVDCHPDSASG
jgi:ribonuclease VapC